MNGIRTTQPYRRHSYLRNPGASLSSMLRGTTGYGYNPKDTERSLMRNVSYGRRSVRSAYRRAGGYLPWA